MSGYWLQLRRLSDNCRSKPWSCDRRSLQLHCHLYSGDTSSPTANIHSVFTVISLGVSERRKFMTFDVFMAYLHAKMDTDVYMTLDAQTTEILLERDKEIGVIQEVPWWFRCHR